MTIFFVQDSQAKALLYNYAPVRSPHRDPQQPGNFVRENHAPHIMLSSLFILEPLRRLLLDLLHTFFYSRHALKREQSSVPYVSHSAFVHVHEPLYLYLSLRSVENQAIARKQQQYFPLIEIVDLGGLRVSATQPASCSDQPLLVEPGEVRGFIPFNY
jgi:hypothetical protein